MKLNIRHQYTLLQSLFWISGSVLFGYAAVLLYHKGLSSAQVGIAAGGAAFWLIFAQQIVDKLVQNIRFLTPKRMILILMLLANLAYLLLGFLPVTGAAAILLYIFVNSTFNCATPLITTIGMDYINRGYKLNYSFARGIGSVSYAISAFCMGQLVEYLNPDVLPYAFGISQTLVFFLVLTIKEINQVDGTAQEAKSAGFFQILKEHQTVRLLAIGFCLSYMANSIVTTYMVDLVYRVGGTDSSFGICCFCNAASEFPAMMLFGFLLHRFSCKTLLKVSSFFFLLKMIVLFFAGSLPMVYFGYLLQSVSFGAFNVLFAFLINNELEPKDRMKGQSIFAIITSGVGSCLGNFAGGAIQDSFGLQVTIGYCVVLTAIGFGICMSARIDKKAKMKYSHS